MSRILLFAALFLSVWTLLADTDYYDDLGSLRPEGGSNEFWNTSLRSWMQRDVLDSSTDSISVAAWSAGTAVASTSEHPATFLPRWYSEGESAAMNLSIQPPPIILILR